MATEVHATISATEQTPLLIKDGIQVQVSDESWIEDKNAYWFSISSLEPDHRIIQYCVRKASQKCKNKEVNTALQLNTFRALTLKSERKAKASQSVYQQELEFRGVNYDLQPSTITITRRPKSDIARVYSSIVPPEALVRVPEKEWWDGAEVVRAVKEFNPKNPTDFPVSFIKYERDKEGLLTTYIDADGKRHQKNGC